MKRKERKDIEGEELQEQQSTEGAVKRSYRSVFIAMVICLLLAVGVWIVVMSRNDSDYIRLAVQNPKDGYTYTLSANVLEVEGTVADLRHAEVIYVVAPMYIEKAGEYRLDASNLVLPEGVSLTGEVSLTLTVTQAP